MRGLRLSGWMFFAFMFCNVGTHAKPQGYIHYDWYIKHDSEIDQKYIKLKFNHLQVKCNGQQLKQGFMIPINGMNTGLVIQNVEKQSLTPALQFFTNKKTHIKVNKLNQQFYLTSTNTAQLYQIHENALDEMLIKANDATDNENYLIDVYTKEKPLATAILSNRYYLKGEKLKYNIQLHHKFLKPIQFKQPISAQKLKANRLGLPTITELTGYYQNQQGVQYFLSIKIAVSVAEKTAVIEKLTLVKLDKTQALVEATIKNTLAHRYGLEATLYGICEDAPDQMTAFMQSQAADDLNLDSKTKQIKLIFNFSNQSKTYRPAYELRHIYLSDQQQLKRVDSRSSLTL